jgi:hypothetical protein
LSKIGDLKVISRLSVMSYRDGVRNAREIGKALGVATLLEGSVRRAGNRGDPLVSFCLFSSGMAAHRVSSLKTKKPATKTKLGESS